MTGKIKDIEKLSKALALEQEAVNRYLRHISEIEHPHINAALEGFRRNEGAHRAEIERHIKRLNGVEKDIEGNRA